MRKIEITANQLVAGLLKIAKVSILDSCGVGQPGANSLIAGIDPVEVYDIIHDDPAETLRICDEKLGSKNLAAIFTISYDFGSNLQGFKPQSNKNLSFEEPDIHLALFDSLVIHDYENGETFLTGNPEKFDQIAETLLGSLISVELASFSTLKSADFQSNFTKSEYLEAINRIKDLIRSGDTYQTNLTQQLSVEVSEGSAADEIFRRLRENHPAPFAAYIDRGHSTVVSASPERFIRVAPQENGGNRIVASPIKGTRRRGHSLAEDEFLRADLLVSEKDRAENTMIVDLMRNDLGRICEYGSVAVDSLCELEEHPTLFHLVSTVSGILQGEITFSDVIRAVFPCGSITGAPKIRTMQIIEEIENVNRGLSMGAIGYRIPDVQFGVPPAFEMSVAIRTMVIRDGKAVFNVGGGVVIDSEAESEYHESLLKAKALLNALHPEENLPANYTNSRE